MLPPERLFPLDYALPDRRQFVAKQSERDLISAVFLRDNYDGGFRL
jgi:hypothetical protein